MENVKLSIIIPVWNGAEMTYEAIQAIMDNTEDYEIIIIDNGSEPPFKAPFTGFNDLTVIRNESNLGFPVAANQGIKVAKGDVVVLYNNDVICTPGWADRLVGWLDEFDIIAPCTNYAAGIQNITIGTYSSRDELDSAAEEFTHSNEGLCYDVNFATISMFIKKKIFDDIGYLDETYWPSSGEDIDIGFRAREAGYRVGVAGDVYVHHEGSKTFEALHKAGLAEYEEVADQNDKHLAERWGDDFWNNQMFEDKDGGTDIESLDDEFLYPHGNVKLECVLSSIKQYAEENLLTAKQVEDVFRSGLRGCGYNATNNIK